MPVFMNGTFGSERRAELQADVQSSHGSQQLNLMYCEKEKKSLLWWDFRTINDAYCKLKCGLYCHFMLTNIRTQKANTMVDENEVGLAIP